MAHVTIGVDLGQKRDPTAIAVAEADKREDGHHFLVRHLERLDLGTPYPAVAARVTKIVAAVRSRSNRTPTVYVDATGVGQPVVDLLSAASAGEVVPVYFTHGDRRIEHTPTPGRREVSLGKAHLVSRLQTLLQCHRLHLPATMPDARVLADELLDYEIRVEENANDRYGAFKVGKHDDLVTALGVSVQVDPRPSGWEMIGLGD